MFNEPYINNEVHRTYWNHVYIRQNFSDIGMSRIGEQWGSLYICQYIPEYMHLNGDMLISQVSELPEWV